MADIPLPEPDGRVWVGGWVQQGWIGKSMHAHAAAFAAAKDKEIAQLRAELIKSLADNAALRAWLEVAQQGLLWYQDTYPDVVNDCDHEVMAQIAAALAARKGEE